MQTLTQQVGGGAREAPVLTLPRGAANLGPVHERFCFYVPIILLDFSMGNAYEVLSTVFETESAFSK